MLRPKQAILAEGHDDDDDDSGGEICENSFVSARYKKHA
jgi:hypothetical protein